MTQIVRFPKRERVRQLLKQGKFNPAEVLEAELVDESNDTDDKRRFVPKAAKKVILSHAELNDIVANRQGWFCAGVLSLGVVAIGLVLAIGVTWSGVKQADRTPQPSDRWCVSLSCDLSN